jgi:hypothetical protein
MPLSIAAFAQLSRAESSGSGHSSAPVASTATPGPVCEETYT